jgi:TRAP-type uncharacterized transport system substrate-binding protein
VRFRLLHARARDLLLFALPVLLLVAVVVTAALYLVNPGPPGTFVVSAASAGSPYYRYAERYREVFKRNGVKLAIRESNGSLDNLARLSDPKSGVDAGIVQGGLASTEGRPELLSLGRVAYEPIWVFYSGGTPLNRLTELKGKRILVGPANSGTNNIALRLLAANGVTAETATLINSELPAYVDLLGKGAADAGFLVLAAEAQTIQRLFRTSNVHLMSFSNADAYTQRFPFLSRLALREGVVDFAADIPSADISLIATTTAVLVREDAHPALVNLLAQAMQETHSRPAIDTAGNTPLFQRAGDFPASSDPEFALSDEARRVYRSGPPFLQRYLPFWVATIVDRLMVSFVVLLPLLIPLLRFAPQIFSWRVRHRIFYWYGQLRRVEAGVKDHAAQLRELDRIEAAVQAIPVPLGFTDRLYELREHIEIVRRRLASKAADASATTPSQQPARRQTS